VDVRTGGVSEEGAAGSIFYTVPVAILATDKKGEQKLFAGCYTLRQVNGQIQEPPFDPIHIEKGALKPLSASSAPKASVPKVSYSQVERSP